MGRLGGAEVRVWCLRSRSRQEGAPRSPPRQTLGGQATCLRSVREGIQTLGALGPTPCHPFGAQGTHLYRVWERFLQERPSPQALLCPQTPETPTS